MDDTFDAERRSLARGAPTDCYVVAYHEDLDGRHMPLRDALREVDYSGSAFISCIPGRLGYFMDEYERYVLGRSQA